MKKSNSKKVLLILIFPFVLLSLFIFARKFVTKAAPPVITINTLITNDSTPTITGTISTTTSTISITISENSYSAINNQNGTWSAEITSALNDGVYDIVATAIDPVDGTSNDNSINELTIDSTKPSITINQKAGQADPTNVNSAQFTVIFSKPINELTFTLSDILISGNTGTITDFTKVGAENTTWNITVTGMSDGETVSATIPADVIEDLIGNTNLASTSTDNQITYDITIPTVTINPIITNDTTPTITGTTDDSTATIRLIVNSVSYIATNNTNDTWTFTIPTQLAEGVYNIEATVTDPAMNSSSDNTVNELTIDTTSPTLTINQATTQKDPSNTSPMTYTIVFSEKINETTLQPSDFTISGSTATVSNLTKVDDTTWSAELSGMATNTTTTLSLASSKITDLAGNNNTASTSTDNQITYDITRPTVTVNQASGQADPTNGLNLLFTIVFSEPINASTFTTDDLSLIAGTAQVTNLAQNTSTQWTATVTGMTTDMTLKLSLLEDKVEDLAGNTNLASTSTDNSITWDHTPPIITINPLTTNVTSPLLTGNIDDSLATIKITVNGLQYNGVNEGDGTWSVQTVVALSNGTYNISATATDTATNIGTDSSTNELTIDTVQPTVTINQKVGQADPTNINSIQFTVVFSESINESTFSASDITLEGTTGTVTGFSKVGTNNTTWNITVTGMTDGDTVVATIPSGVINDLAGNSNTASTSTDNKVTYDITKPTVTVNQMVGQPDPTNINSAKFTVILSEPINEVSFTPSIISIAGGPGTITGFQRESATEWSVTIAGMNSVSTISLSISAGKFTDLAGNSNTASTSTDNTVTYDATPPVITINTLFTQNRSPELTGTIDDNSAIIKITVEGIEYSATNNTNGTWSLPASIINTLSDGTYNIIAKATDTVGNTGQDTSNNELTIDNVAPTITVANTITNKHTPTVGGSIDDDDTIIKVTVNSNTYTANHSAIGRWSLTIPDHIPNGTYDISASATDKAGNVGSDTSTGELIIDDTLLTVEVTIPDTQPNPTNTNQVIFIFTFSCQNVIPSTFTSDDIAIIGSTTASVTNFIQLKQDTWQVTVNGMTDGDTITAELPAGKVENIYGNLNQESTESNAYVTYDITPPTVTVDNLITNNTSPQLTGTVNDEYATIKVTINGIEYSATNNGDDTWILPHSTISKLIDGKYDAIVKATDLALNNGYDTTTNEIEIDTIKPTVTINQKAEQNDPTNINSALFTIIFSKPINESTFDASDITLSGTTGAVTRLTKIDNLTYEIEVTYMTDGDIAKVEIEENKIFGNAGNGNEKSSSTDNTVTYDITPPVIDITTQYGNTSSPVIEGVIDDKTATIQVSINGNTYSAKNNGNGTWILQAGIITPPLIDDEYTFSVTASDLAGNTTTTAIEKVITIDTISPTGTLNPIPDGIDTSPELSGTVDDITAEISVLVNGVKYNAINNKDQTWTLAKGSLINLKPSIYDVIVSFTDPAGNYTNDPTSNELSILRPDANIPTVDTLKFIGNKPVITGTYDSKNSLQLSILTNDVKYTLGINPELTTDGDIWKLDLTNLENGLILGVYDVKVEIISRDGSVITDITTNELTLMAPPKPQEQDKSETAEKEDIKPENKQLTDTVREDNNRSDETTEACKKPSIIAPTIIAVLLLIIILLTQNNLITVLFVIISCGAWYLFTKGDCQIYWSWPIVYSVGSILVSVLAKKKLQSKK